MSEPEHAFAISSEWTGKFHTFSVEIRPTREAMLEHLLEHYPAGGWEETNDAGETAAGAFLNAAGFMSNDAPEHLGTIHLNAEFLDVETVVHEVVHAACFAYDCDVLGNHSRARAHLNGTNEELAYLIGDLAGQIAFGLKQLGL